MAALNLRKRLALLSDGRTVPVTNMFDASGDDTTECAEAVSFVAGSGREWFCDSTAGFEEVTTQ